MSIAKKKSIIICVVAILVVALIATILIGKKLLKKETDEGSIQNIDYSKNVVLGDYECLVVSVKKHQVSEEDVTVYIDDMLKNQGDVTCESLTDADVKRIFQSKGYQTVEELKSDVRRMLEQNEETNFSNSIHNALLEQLKTVCYVKEIPEKILKARVEKDMDDIKAMSKEENMELEEYLEKYYSKTVDEYRSASEEYVRKNLELVFILSAIAQKEGIELDEEGYQNYINEKMEYFGYKNKKELYKESPEEDRRIAYVCEKTIDFLKKSMIVTEEKE